MTDSNWVTGSDSGESIIEARCLTCAATPGAQPSELWEMWAAQHAAGMEHRVIVSYGRTVEYAG